MLKNVSGQSIGAQMVSASDGSAFTGSVTVLVTGDNGTQTTGSVGSGAATHEGNGYHSYAPAQAETNYDHVAFTFTGMGAVPVTIQVFTDQAYDRIGAAGAGLTEAGGTGDQFTAIPWNADWDAEVQSEANDALVALGLDHLVSASVVGGDVADNSIIARMVSSAGTADWDTFDNTTDALQALRDRGDAAWTTGGGGSITDILNVIPMIPSAIDLADTASWRIGLLLYNALDDLPTTAEITPGTISIDRKAQGGTSWTAVVTDAACSESAGMIYYDEVFDSGSGYASGDMLRVTFKGQSITVSANDYEITDSTGRIFYTGIITSTPNVNVAQISDSSSAADVLELFAGILNQGTGQLDDGSLTSGTITATKIGTGAFTAEKFAADFLTASGLAADAVAEIQSGLATAAALATVDGIVDDILVDTDTTIPGLIAALNDPSVADILTTQMTESYASAGTVPTLAQAILAIHQQLQRAAVSGTTMTVRNVADNANAFTLALDDGTTPTSIGRAT